MAYPIHLNTVGRWVLFSTLLFCWFSGLLFFVFDGWIRVEGEFGQQRHPLQQIMLSAHGASAFLMLILFGFMLKNHVALLWRANKNRSIGITIVMSFIVLIITGYFLYYASAELFRLANSYLHIGIGILFPCFVLYHSIPCILRRTKSRHEAIRTQS